MTISEAMQSPEFDLRLSCGDRWLVFDGEGWSVYEQKRRQRVRLVHLTDDEDKAVSILVATNP